MMKKNFKRIKEHVISDFFEYNCNKIIRFEITYSNKTYYITKSTILETKDKKEVLDSKIEYSLKAPFKESKMNSVFKNFLRTIDID